MNQKLKKRFIKLLIFTSSLSGAAIGYSAVQLKAFGGSTSASQRYEADRDSFDAFSFYLYDYTQYKKTNAVNLLTPGVGIIVNKDLMLSNKFVNKVNVGLELNLQRQLEGYKFDSDTDQGESAFFTGEMMKIQVDNKYKTVLNAVLKFADRFYVKLGPSLMKQHIKSTVFTTDFPKAINRITKVDKKNIFGVNLGSGFVYPLTKNVSVFSELNYTYFFQKDLSNFVYNPLELEAAPLKTDPVTTYNRKFKFTQADFLLGVVVDLDFYKNILKG